MNREAAPTCAPCGVKKQPWSLNNWKCPKCGAVGVSGETEIQRLTRRVEDLEEQVAALVAKRKRVA